MNKSIKQLYSCTKQGQRISYEDSTVFVKLTSEAVERSPERGLVTAGAGDELPIPLF